MSEVSTPAVAGGGPAARGDRGGAGTPSVSGGFFDRYKPEQGKWTRGGTFVGILALAVWGASFFWERLEVYSGDKWWQLVVTIGIPLACLLGGAILGWWFAYTNRKSSDFMIATEGEMKKVSWSSRREVIGSTKVVIVLTLIMAVLLFTVDFVLQNVFRWIGVLKV